MATIDQDANKSILPLRENLVKTAVEFLQNPKVASSPTDRKQEFLRSKGLTEEEIKSAFQLASVEHTAEQNVIYKPKDYTVVPMPPPKYYPPYLQQHPYQISLFHKIREFFNTTALIGATIYCLYWFYKKSIEFLFGRKKKKSIKDSVSELDKTIQSSMKDVKQSISKVEDDVQKLTQNQFIDPMVPQLVQELKQDLASLKSLLLSRKQFPSAPPSIPSWQLRAADTNQEKQNEQEDDTGSGGSTNYSDSSLEMIREDLPKKSSTDIP